MYAIRYDCMNCWMSVNEPTSDTAAPTAPAISRRRWQTGELWDRDVGGLRERRHWIRLRSAGGTSSSVACSLSCSARM